MNPVIRICALSKTQANRTTMIRLVRLPTHQVVIDTQGTQKGRSVHIANTPENKQILKSQKKTPYLAHLLRCPAEEIKNLIADL